MQARRAEFEVVYREYSPRVLTYALHRGATLNEAEDVVAETFLVCWRRLDEVRGDILPWLFGVAHRTLANQRRSRRRRAALGTKTVQEFRAEASGDETALGAQGVDPELLRALSQLSEREREVLLLVAWEGLTYQEAAQALGCTVTTVGVRLHRARARLLKYLGDIRTHTDKEPAAVVEEER